MCGGSEGDCAGGVIDCANAVTAGSLADDVNGPFYDVYLLAARGNISSSAGFACGLFYAGNNPEGDSDGQGIEVFDFTGCTGYSLPSNPVWPKPTSYVLWYWDSEYNCRSDELFVAGYFYLGVSGNGDGDEHLESNQGSGLGFSPVSRVTLPGIAGVMGLLKETD